jgi:hypothetical protein
VIIRNKKGRFIDVPAPKFFDGQIVTTTSNYFSPKEITMVVSPHYSDLGWVYGEHYCGTSGGKITEPSGWGFSFEEKYFEPLTNPKHILMAEVFYRESEKKSIERRLAVLESELKNINYALKLLEVKS